MWENTNIMQQDTLYYLVFFSGQSKPSNLNDYFRKFVDEYKELNEDGFDINGKHFNVQLDSVICDAPARAFVKLSRVILDTGDVISVLSMVYM